MTKSKNVIEKLPMPKFVNTSTVVNNNSTIPTNKITGRVLWFIPPKGIGCIQSDNLNYFVHYNDIIKMPGYKKLQTGDKVIFIPQNTNQKNMKALEVELIFRQPRYVPIQAVRDLANSSVKGNSFLSNSVLDELF